MKKGFRIKYKPSRQTIILPLPITMLARIKVPRCKHAGYCADPLHSLNFGRSFRGIEPVVSALVRKCKASLCFASHFALSLENKRSDMTVKTIHALDRFCS